MNDFADKIKAAEREVKAKAIVSQNSKNFFPPKYGYKKDGTPRKRPAREGRWKKGEIPEGATPFKPGQSGNPGGRMQKTPITDAMRAMLHLPYEGKEARFRGMTNAQVLARRQFEYAVETGDMRAAIEIADRVEGKVPQGLQHSGPDGGAITISSLTPEENERRISELMQKVPTE